MYRVLLYPLIVVVAASGLVGGRWLEQSGLLYGLIERGGTAAGVPERVFQEGPGQPPPEADVQPRDRTTGPEEPTDGAPEPTDTSAPAEDVPTEETATEETATEETTEETSPTEETTTESPSPAPSG